MRGGGRLCGGVKGDSWSGLMGDEIGGGGVRMTLASVQWSDGVRRPLAVREGDEEDKDKGCDASRCLQTGSD